MTLSWRLIWLFLKAPGMAVTQRCRQSFLPFTSSNTSLSSPACTTPELTLHAATSEHASSCSTHNCFRGYNAGDLRLSKFQTPTESDSPAIPFLVPEMTLQAGSQLPIFPDVTNTWTSALGRCATPFVRCAQSLRCLACLSHTPCKHPTQGDTCCSVAVQVSSNPAKA